MSDANLDLLMDVTFLRKKYGGIARDNLHVISEFANSKNTYFLGDKKSTVFNENRINLRYSLEVLNAYCAFKGRPKKSFKWIGNYYQTHINGLSGVVNGGNTFLRVHDFFPLTHPEWFSRHGVKVFENAFKFIDPKTVLICNSTTTATSMQQFNKTKKMQTLVLPCKPELVIKGNRELVECGSCVACKGFAPELNYLLAVSTIEPRKNYRNLLEAWVKVKNRSRFTQLIIIGRLGWKSKNIFNLLNNEPSVGLISVCDFALQKFYENASGFISTSFDEGFNLPAAEAASYGIPIALSDVDVHREFHEDYAYFFNPYSIKSIEHAIINFPYNEPQGRSQFFTNLWENGIANFKSYLNNSF
jgi:glycosyltransferase involved in cell wall biosynthesis